ncbi:MAG: SDR family oxidoreductase [Cellulomonadaceae bacterium]|jgi:3-oxoacyl-[acyl-carrier protein] reductase|nr:SDR family oxidoreductase [Cellulomonadaceae bacterium]
MTTPQWAFVTGASRGIGREMARALAAAKVNVAVQARTLDATADLVAELTAAGVDAFAVAGDLGDSAAVRAMADEVAERAAIDLLFNNAGIQKPAQGTYWVADAAEYADSFAVNVTAPMILVERFLPGMVDRGFGRITNTSSGIENQPEQGAYAASKGALNKVTHDFAAVLGEASGVDVAMNISDPGWIRTDLGGPHAPNDVTTVVPGMIVGGFTPVEINGCWIGAQEFTGMTLEEAVAAAPEKVRRLAVTEPF